MQHNRSSTRVMVIMAAAVVIVLVLGVLLMGQQTAAAGVVPGSVFVAYYQGTEDTNKKSQESDNKDKTQEAGDKGKITICHVPPGNPENAQTITIDRSAWKTDGKGSGGHGPGLHGGDYVGACLAS